MTKNKNRMLNTDEAAEEIGYDVTSQKLRTWRMDKDHPLPFFKRSETPQSHCFYKWEDLQAFKKMIKSGEYVP